MYHCIETSNKKRFSKPASFSTEDILLQYRVTSINRDHSRPRISCCNIQGNINQAINTCFIKKVTLQITLRDYCSYIGCSAKMYPIFVLFISPVKIEIFQVCLFHIIGNFVFHPNFFFLNIY